MSLIDGGWHIFLPLRGEGLGKLIGLLSRRRIEDGTQIIGHRLLHIFRHLERTARVQEEYELLEQNASRKISEINKISEILDFLRNGDYLSISCPEDVSVYLAEHIKAIPAATCVGFNGKRYSVINLRDKIFRKAMLDGIEMFLINASCLNDYFTGKGPVTILEWETELETIATVLECIIIMVHDENKVDPNIAMTQPYVFDGCSEKFIRNDFAIPAKHYVNRIKCTDDTDWLRTFRRVCY